MDVVKGVLFFAGRVLANSSVPESIYWQGGLCTEPCIRLFPRNLVPNLRLKRHFSTGYCQLSGPHRPDKIHLLPMPEERGALFEGLVAQLIRAYMDYRGICEDLYYWGPSGRSTTEVDFLLVRGTELIGVEAKSGKTFTEAWCRGLRAVSGLKGLRRRIIVYPQGPVLQTKDGIDVIPFQNFADQLAENTLWI